MNYHRGIVTLAYGDAKNLDFAVNLARSIRCTNPNESIAIVTDRTTYPRFDSLFDIQIPLNVNYGRSGLLQKMYIHDYSPYSRTIFIDADCLVFKNLNSLFKLIEERYVFFLGSALTKGDWWFNIEQATQYFGVGTIPKLNSGVFGFRKCADSVRFFEDAKDFEKRYSELEEPIGITRLQNARIRFIDEVAYSLALIQHPGQLVEDYRIRRQAGPAQWKAARVKMNVLKEVFQIAGPSGTFSPFVAHYFNNHTISFHYCRETGALRIWETLGRSRFSRVLASLFRGAFTVVYASFNLIYLAIFRLLGRSKPMTFMECVPLDHFGGGIRAQFKK